MHTTPIGVVRRQRVIRVFRLANASRQKFGLLYNTTWGYSAISGLQVHTSSAVSVYGARFILARIGRFNLAMFLMKKHHQQNRPATCHQYVGLQLCKIAKRIFGKYVFYTTNQTYASPHPFSPSNDSLAAEVNRTQQCDPAASGISTRIRTLFAYPRLL